MYAHSNKFLIVQRLNNGSPQTPQADILAVHVCIPIPKSN